MKGLFDDSGDHPDFAWDEKAFKFLGEEDKREDYLMELTDEKDLLLKSLLNLEI